jgi:hypothetical protein
MGGRGADGKECMRDAESSWEGEQWIIWYRRRNRVKRMRTGIREL